MHAKPSSFVTLTYDDDHLVDPSLNYADFQRFRRRLVAKVGPVRFFVAGEYGAETLRPHWHAILFGCPFPDMQPLSPPLGRSKSLEQLWPFGFSSVGEVNFKTAAYVASYSLKKLRSGRSGHSAYVTLDLPSGELIECVPPFCRMSLRPGIGFSWFQKYWREVFEARDGIVLPGGKVVPAPRFYYKKLGELQPFVADSVAYDRYVSSARFIEDSTPERLAVREVVAQAAMNQRGRGL